MLQNTCHEWIAAVLGLKLKAPLAALTPGYQKGPIRGRYVFEQLWEAASTRASLPNGLFYPIGFSKASVRLVLVRAPLVRARGMRHNIQGANGAPRKLCRAPWHTD